MKKHVVSVLLLISFSFQSTYSVFDSIKARFGGSIAQARSMLSARENIRCLRVGDNCSKEKRILLSTISALLAALVAAGIAMVGRSVMGKKGGATVALESEAVPESKAAHADPKKIEEIWNYALNNLQDSASFMELKKKIADAGLTLADIVIPTGESLIGAFILKMQTINVHSDDQIEILRELLKTITPTKGDEPVVKGTVIKDAVVQSMVDLIG